MNYLAENAVPIWMGGAVLLVLALVVYWQTRTNAVLVAMCVIALVMAALLLTEHLIETPREAVERTLYELADAVEGNDVPAALSFIAPGASRIRSDVERAMPQAIIDKANVIGEPQSTVDMTDQPPTASVKCRGFVHGTLKRNGMTGGELAEMTIVFVHDGDRWLVQDYTSSKDWRRAAGR
jgi:hypothetical protein